MWATSAAMPNENTHAATIDQNAIAIGFGMRFFSITVLICKFCGRVGSSVPFSHLLGGLQIQWSRSTRPARSRNDRAEFFSDRMPDHERSARSGHRGECIGGCAIIVGLTEVNAEAQEDHQCADKGSKACVKRNHGCLPG
jgi:hypothetical protein